MMSTRNDDFLPLDGTKRETTKGLALSLLCCESGRFMLLLLLRVCLWHQFHSAFLKISWRKTHQQQPTALPFPSAVVFVPSSMMMRAYCDCPAILVLMLLADWKGSMDWIRLHLQTSFLMLIDVYANQCELH